MAKLFFSETVRGMKPVPGIHVPDINLHLKKISRIRWEKSLKGVDF